MFFYVSVLLIFRELTHSLTVWSSEKKTGVTVMAMTEDSLPKSLVA